jgi:hypothetical protein
MLLLNLSIGHAISNLFASICKSAYNNSLKERVGDEVRISRSRARPVFRRRGRGREKRLGWRANKLTGRRKDFGFYYGHGYFEHVTFLRWLAPFLIPYVCCCRGCR